MVEANARLRGRHLITAPTIRDAATVILVRDPGGAPSVLMGQRGAGAVFMPSKFVFPGGAVDPSDADIRPEGRLSDVCLDRLATRPTGASAETLAVAAIRELWEETGQALARGGLWPDAPEDWADFAAAGQVPDVSGLRFFFRAVTPEGRPRRFDARFFLADAATLATDPDAVPEATSELSRLQWVPIDQAHQLDLAFITQLVLAEVSAHLPSMEPPERVPFVTNDTLDNTVHWL